MLFVGILLLVLSVAEARSVPVASEFFLGLPGGRCEDFGGILISTTEECRNAHDMLGLTRQRPWNGSSGSIPKNCSTRQGVRDNALIPIFIDDMHWNTASSGQGSKDISPVCKFAVPCRSDQFYNGQQCLACNPYHTEYSCWTVATSPLGVQAVSNCYDCQVEACVDDSTCDFFIGGGSRFTCNDTLSGGVVIKDMCPQSCGNCPCVDESICTDILDNSTDNCKKKLANGQTVEDLCPMSCRNC